MRREAPLSRARHSILGEDRWDSFGNELLTRESNDDSPCRDLRLGEE